MTYARFEDIPAWQGAIRLAEGVYDMTESKGWPGSRSLQDQLERVALSVSNDIAEGFESGTTNPCSASGSAAIVSLISNLKSTAESCSRQLRGWADCLQNSEIRGQRHLNAKTRQRYDAAKTAEEFQQELLERLPPDHSLRKRPRQL